jgi:uncharacterized protein with FMN-binding domain
MLNSNGKRQSLAGKLLLSSALVAVSLGYGWWQQHAQDGPALATAPVLRPAAPNKFSPVPRGADLMASAPSEPTQPVMRDTNAVSGEIGAARQGTATPQAQKSVAVAKAAPQTDASSVTPSAPDAQPQHSDEPSSSPPSTLTAQQALQMNVPTEGASPPLPLVTGSPEPGAVGAMPAGTHLADGEYVSSKHELMWGDLRIKISIQGGLITGVQALQFPDHRSQSLYLSQMALPILESEVIKSQKAQVDTVSSATDTSYTFQDAVADAIVKATRG